MTGSVPSSSIISSVNGRPIPACESEFSPIIRRACSGSGKLIAAGQYRRARVNRREFISGLVALPALVRPARAEASVIKLGKQYGLPFLPQMVMEDRRLIEAHASQLGSNGLGVVWQTMGGPGALNDGLLSGNIQFFNVDSAYFATLWDKTFGTPQEVRAVCAVQSMPYILTTRNPAVKTIADFSAGERIAAPAVQISGQAMG